MHTVHTRNITLLPAQLERIENKLSKISRHLGTAFDGEAGSIKTEIVKNMHSKANHEKFSCDITIHMPDRVVLRATQRSLSPEASFDLAFHKVDRQIRKLRTKRSLRNTHSMAKDLFAFSS